MTWIVFAIFLGEVALFVLARVVNRAQAESDVTRGARRDTDMSTDATSWS